MTAAQPHTAPLTVPDVTGMDAMTAAFAYAKAGLYVGPVKKGTKHPGSILGKQWQSTTTRDPQVIADYWLTHTDAGIFLHVGRSGAIVLDVDTPTKLPNVLTDALTKHPAPFQRTRRSDAARRHYIYRQPQGRTLGNGLGQLPTGWGDLRGANGVIIVAPSTHPDEDGHYAWGRTGNIPELPHTIAELLTDTTTPVDVATDHTIRAFITTHNQGTDTDKLKTLVATYKRYIKNGDSRHGRAVSLLTGALKEAAAGYYPAPLAEQHIREAFLDAVATPGHGNQGKARTGATALEEWRGILAWAVAQATHADPLATIERAEDHGARDLNTLIDTRPTQPAANAHDDTGGGHQDQDGTPHTGDGADHPVSALDRLLSPGSPAAAGAPVEEPPSWRPVDLTTILDGTWTATHPTLFTRTDGQPLFYPGLVHNLYGESESGKSWVAQAATVQALTNGHRVAFIDFESDAPQVVNRLRTLGATPHHLTPDTFAYIRPEAAPATFHEAEAFTTLTTQPWDLVILDGVTEALVMSGKATMDNDDITAWMRQVPRHIATGTGAAVILIDHVVKSTEGRGRFPIGGQAKMAAIDGASYLAEPVSVLGAGLDGAIRLRVGKDRPGQVRPHGGAWRASDRTQEIAHIRVDSTHADGTTTITIQPPENGALQARDNDQPFRPTKVMEKVSKILETMREPISRRGLYKAYRESGAAAKETTVAEAINLLVEAGNVLETEGARNARMFRSAMVYRSHSDPLSDDYTGNLEAFSTPNTDRLPTVSDRLPGDGATVSQRPSPTVPPFTGDGDGRDGPQPTQHHSTVSHPRDTPDTYINHLTGEIHTGGDPQW